MASLPLLVGVLAVLFGLFFQSNPFLFGRKVGSTASSYRIYTEHPIIEEHLQLYAEEIGADYTPYRNHCLRVLSFAVYHLTQELKQTAAAEPNTADSSHENVVHPAERDIEIMALALAYHDIALWSDGALSYLEPSARQLEIRLKEHSSSSSSSKSIDQEEDDEKETTDEAPTAATSSWTETEVVTALEIILQHHKVTSWQTPTTPGNPVAGVQADARLVNAVRKGDWADATLGVVRYGLPADLLEAAYEQIPEAGFHKMLANFGSRLSPDSLLGQLDVLKILRW